jgi:NADH:ubiquinone oxidoreductase subunit 4 (subunit M)
LVFAGGWDVYPVSVICGIVGIVITAVYMLRLVRGTFFGPSQPAFAHASDARTPFARLPYVVLIVVLLVVGCWPQPLLRIIDASSRPFIERVVPVRPVQLVGAGSLGRKRQSAAATREAPAP